MGINILSLIGWDLSSVFCSSPFFFLAVWTIFEYVEAVSYIFTNLSNYDGILSLINT